MKDNLFETYCNPFYSQYYYILPQTQKSTLFTSHLSNFRTLNYALKCHKLKIVEIKVFPLNNFLAQIELCLEYFLTLKTKLSKEKIKNCLNDGYSQYNEFFPLSKRGTVNQGNPMMPVLTGTMLVDLYL